MGTEREMSLLRLWWTGVSRPAKAFTELKLKAAPAWGFRVVLIFNLLICLTTVLPLHLLRQPLFLDSWLTFLSNENYRLAELFFLPPLRVVVWTIGAAAIHLGLRLSKQASNFDLLLNVGGLGYLIVMPFVLLSDWLLIAFDAYWLAEYTHPVAALWGMILTVIGLKKLLEVKTAPAIGLALISLVVSIPPLAIFAR